MKTTPITTTTDAEALLSEELESIFGVGTEGIEEDRALGSRMPMAYFNRLVDVVDRSGAVEKIEAWIAEDRKSNAGRKPLIGARAALVTLLLNNHWGHANTYVEYGLTIGIRFTQEQRDALDINLEGTGKQDWYNRTWRAMQRVLRVLDPFWQTSKKERLSGAAFQRALELKDRDRHLRLEEIMNLINRSAIQLLPKSHLDGYRGDIAQDATLIEVAGRIDNAKTGEARWNVEFSGGAYRREGDHKGTGASTDKYGYELETVTMIDMTNGAFAFPLISGISIHRPGRLKTSPLRAFQEHTRFWGQPGHLVTDRAYNNLKAFRYQEHVRRAGYWTVYDYQKNQLGPQGTLEKHPVILVDGSLYVAYMPEHLQMISRRWKTGEIDPATGSPYTEETARKLLDAREPYRLKPMGRPDKEGYQRFQYPDPRGYVAVDPATGRPMNPRETEHLTGKITVPPSERITRSIQKYPWYSDDWHRAYGQRNQVENSNKTLKDVGSGDIENKKRRTGRGIAFHGLVAGFAIAAENIRRIIVGIVKAARGKAPKTTRGRKRYDVRGNRLAPQTRPTSHASAVSTVKSAEEPPARQ